MLPATRIIPTIIDRSIKNALKEDIGSGDITTTATISASRVLEGFFLAKEAGIIAGLEVARRVFFLSDPNIVYRANISDGTPVKKGTILASVQGSAKSILSSERVALNYLQRMSGIATQTRRFVLAVKGTGAIILDTRKTAPGLRVFDKWAVKLGGGHNHRFGLFDMVLVKDNHIAAAGGITNAVRALRRKSRKPIEIEVTTMEQLREAVSLRPDRIMLDNMSVAQMKEAVRLVGSKVPLEASGNVNLKNVSNIAKTGVTYISIGSLTHSVKALDISLEMKPYVHGT
ncbi:carboxylating nicotinate-nucleotide diphosphorylase [Patescibacteria group bacterium]|nr:carboxylating nicotinate-nucleotide diphosphorylase [Patescibacteria group bacterium]MBU1473214.1 carboxylating nicotinate-nucleotide diphosphorylase [Patescibacteria group bacterium]MBU2459928.1 carboxylating nicotinate-nucleotide diphosphorylase [Patescibacteria group bacterium]MBU2544129.1 carboxylating nicotinate-nucleotide diphosphorylase [Patescibacteria group bacterium]